MTATTTNLTTENPVATILERFIGVVGQTRGEELADWKKVQIYRKFLALGEAWADILLLNHKLNIEDVATLQRDSQRLRNASMLLNVPHATIVSDMKFVLRIFTGEDSIALRTLGKAFLYDPSDAHVSELQSANHDGG